MIARYYQEELARLKEFAAGFAAAHPALAPMLAGPSSDPDVERLLEGVAFQNGLLRQKLDDDFPELVHDLARLVCPQYLRPIPASTIVAFSPRPSLDHSRVIPAGTELSSVPLDETRCLFRTCSDIEFHPLELLDASFAQSTRGNSSVTITFELRDRSLNNWAPDRLRLFLADEYRLAAQLYFLLRRHLLRIVIEPEKGGTTLTLPPECLRPAGFQDDEALFPYPSHASPGYRLLQEYFALPQRFLFLDLFGWERWVERGTCSRFSVRFELSDFKFPPPRVNQNSFALFAAPVVNLFSRDADPIILDHRKERYLVRPAALPPHHAQIFSIDEVSGFVPGVPSSRHYKAFELLRPYSTDAPTYHETMTPPTARDGYDLYLVFPYPTAGMSIQGETISIQLTCTNGDLPKGLRIGDVCHPTVSSPECATFRNITHIAPGAQPPLGPNLLWRLLSHHSLTSSSIDSSEKLQALLGLYLFTDGSDEASPSAANRKRIEGIKELVASPAHRLVRGVPIRGTEVRISINGDHFAGGGDLFIFGSVLDHFFSGLATLNTFTHLIINDTAGGATIDFRPRLGNRPLL